ncbi:MAG: hypothetical protein KF734_18715 [Saprospiraceae bacterium]|nr:hypothetical protein [Saprospiraceae bacterium]
MYSNIKSNIKKALTCQRIQNFDLNTRLVATHIPQAGDVGIFKVLQACGNIIIGPDKQSVSLFDGDLVMLAFGSRYATNQVEGYVPESPVRHCHLLGRGGVAGMLASKNALFKTATSQLELVGYATGRNDSVLNTIRWKALDSFNRFNIRAKVILSVGSSMDSGKTTSAAWLCGGLRAAGKRVGYIKLTGTTFPKDATLNLDRGAHFAADFSHFGFPSTYLLDLPTLLDLYQSLINLACDQAHVDYIVMEIADGLLQRETAMLLNDPGFRSSVHGVLFSACDSLSVISGLQILEEYGVRPFAVSGLFTASELLIKEVKSRIDVPILRLADLLTERATSLCAEAEDLLATEGVWSDVQQERRMRA